MTRSVDPPRGMIAVTQAACSRNGSPDACAAMLRRLFCQEMQRRGVPGYGEHALPCDALDKDRWGRRRFKRSVWLTAADKLIEHRLDPLVLIISTFMLSESLPQPSDLLSAGSISVCRNYVATLPERLRSIYRSASQSVKTRISELRRLPRLTDLEVVEMALRETGQVSASPLFRYCLAVRSNLPVVAAGWSDTAFAELVLSPVTYQQVWPAAFIPPDFLQEACAERLAIAAAVRGGLALI